MGEFPSFTSHYPAWWLVVTDIVEEEKILVLVCQETSREFVVRESRVIIEFPSS